MREPKTKQEDQFSRTRELLGETALDALKKSRVAIFGIGGVGGFVAEALGRAGVGNILLVDNDKISASNINRQIIALNSTIGQDKTQVMKKRLLDINPHCNVKTKTLFYLPDTKKEIELEGLSYIADCMDTVTAKLCLIQEAFKNNVKIISCMGTGNKLDASLFRISDISKTSVCPLCKIIRHKTKELKIEHLSVLWSPEVPKKTKDKDTIASISFVPSVAGLLIAQRIIRYICNI